jgi:hypothetical protein
MEKLYEVTIVRPNYKFERTDYTDIKEAFAAVEAAGTGRVVSFVRDFDGRERSCAMAVYENGAWRNVSIC